MWAEKLAARKPEDLSPAERAALNAHVTSCTNCSVIRRDYDLLTRRIRVLRTPAVKLSPPNPANAPWHTQQPGFSGLGRRSHGSFGQKMSRMIPQSSSRRIGLGMALAATSILIALLALFLGYSSLQESAQVSVEQTITTAAVKGFTSICPLPPDQSNANCFARYTGNYTSTLNKSSIPITLVIQQRQRVISGSCTLSLSSTTVNIPISGSVDEKGNFKLDIIISHNLIIHFVGSVYSNGSMSGTYTTSTGERGTWTVKLSQSQS